MTTTTLSQDQLDAVCDAQDEDDVLAELPEIEVAKRLAAGGHPMFEGFVSEAEAEKAEKKAETKPAKKPRKKRAAAKKVTPPQAPPPSAATAPTPGDTVPELDTGTPAAEVVLPVSPEPAQRDAATESQPPARRGDSAHLPLGRPRSGVGVEGMETLGQGDLVIPGIQLKQAQTRDDHELGISNVPDGDWFLTNDPEEAVQRSEAAPDEDRPRVVSFLEVRPGRQFMLPYDDDDRAEELSKLGLLDAVSDEASVICSSTDRVRPSVRDGQEWDPLALSCRECPHSRWTTGASGKRRPPACGETYRALVVDLTDGQETPARMFFRSTAIRPVKALLTNLAISAKRHRVPMCGLVVELGSKEKRGKKGTYFVPAFSRPGLLEDEEKVAGFRAMREGLAGEGDHGGQGEA